MKIFTTLAVCVVVASAQLQSLSDSVKDIPSCVLGSFKSALEAEGCDTEKVDGKLFQCWCSHISGISNHLVKDVNTQCLTDFADAYGHACGAFNVYGTTASDWAEATSALASELGAKATGGSASATTTGAADSTAKADSGGATSTSSDDAAAPTAMPKVLGLVGGAAAAIVPFIL